MSYPTLYSPYDTGLWDSLAAEAMALQCCDACKTFRYPPGAACPGCLSGRFTWTKISGAAKLLSWATFHRQYLPAYPVPHTVVAAELAEGPILIAGIDEDQRSSLHLDAPLQVTTRPHPEGYRIPWFTLRGDAS